jgi:hypothetical protein
MRLRPALGVPRQPELPTVTAAKAGRRAPGPTYRSLGPPGQGPTPSASRSSDSGLATHGSHLKYIGTNPDPARGSTLVVPTLGQLVFLCWAGAHTSGGEVPRVHDPEMPCVVVERCEGQRLYDADLRRYITVDDLYAWQLMSVPFIVRDAESGKDVTADILLAPAGLH